MKLRRRMVLLLSLGQNLLPAKGAFPLKKSPPVGGLEILRFSLSVIYSLMMGTAVPARSPITLTKSLSAGTMILVLSFNASARIVQKPHPKYFALENWVILPWLQLLAEWNHLLFWNSIIDGLVHPQAHFLNHF